MGAFSFTHIAIVLLIALLLFGPNKLPEVGRSLGNALREFKKATREFGESIESIGKEDSDAEKKAGEG